MTDHDDLLDQLRTELPLPPTARLGDADRWRLYGEVTATARASDVRRERLASLGSVALVAASLVAVVALVLVAVGSGSPPPSAAPSADARTVVVLDRMSAVAFTTPAPAVREDQYVYVRSQVVSNDGALGGPVELTAPHPREIWLSQRERPEGDEAGVIREFGQDWPLSYSGGAPGLVRPTYAWLASLPTDPDPLERALRAEATPAEGQSADQALFDAVGDLIRESVLPPRLASALFRVVARIPGVTVDPAATDAIGREGVGIGRTDERFGVRSVWVFRAGTPQLLGTRDYLVSAGKAPVLFGASAVLERGVAEREGETP